MRLEYRRGGGSEYKDDVMWVYKIGTNFAFLNPCRRLIIQRLIQQFDNQQQTTITLQCASYVFRLQYGFHQGGFQRRNTTFVL
jgi:hypothetical protein